MVELPVAGLVVVLLAAVSAIISVIAFGMLIIRPLVRTWIEVREAQNEMLPMIREVVTHVRTDSGTSLLDIVQRLDEAAKAQVQAATIMSATLERLEGKADAASEVESEARSRADATIGEPGEAADAAASNPE